MKTMIVIVLIACGGLGIVWGAGWLTQGKSQMPTAAEEMSTLRPINVVRGIGYVEPASDLRRMVFKIDGVVANVAVDVGQKVKEGDVLVTLANADETAQLFEAERQVA